MSEEGRDQGLNRGDVKKGMDFAIVLDEQEERVAAQQANNKMTGAASIILWELGLCNSFGQIQN